MSVAMSQILDHVKHLMPTQRPLKDFIHHNTLHAFQSLEFHAAQREAMRLFRSRNYLSAEEYFRLLDAGKVSAEICDHVLKNKPWTAEQKARVLSCIRDRRGDPEASQPPGLRDLWRTLYGLDLVSHVQPRLFRHLGHFLDQGLSVFKMPHSELSFFEALRRIESEAALSLFRDRKGPARQLFLEEEPLTVVATALSRLVGEADLYEIYVREMCLEHPGWSGMVGVIEDAPEALSFTRRITFAEAVAFELLLEVDYVTSRLGAKFKPIGRHYVPSAPRSSPSLGAYVLEVMQDAYEWTYYDAVLGALKVRPKLTVRPQGEVHFQLVTCIDDRCCSLRRHIEELEPSVQTFGTPGFFGLEFYFKPHGRKWLTKLCPAPIEPRHVIHEVRPRDRSAMRSADVFLQGLPQTFTGGWFISQALGFWAAVKLFMNVFRPSFSPATASSLQHTHREAKFHFVRREGGEAEDGLLKGFTHDEMAERIAGTLRSIGLVDGFAPVVLMLAHGSTTTNNPHFAAYDCGACSGKPGSVNARLFAIMANLPEVRQRLVERGVRIPDTTWFVAGIHDTTRDEIEIFSNESPTSGPKADLKNLRRILDEALDRNAKERARRFDSIALNLTPNQAHEAVKRRSVSICETRPELNHANNSLAIVGRRSLTSGVFLDRRAFLNSYDPHLDPHGEMLARILGALVPVCGGINLEYYFSRVDNQKFGAGTKLPHNVVGLFAVSNGTEGDLKTGLPYQMIDLHEPLRLMVIVEQKAEIVLSALARIPSVTEWLRNRWVHLSIIHPETREIEVFNGAGFAPYAPMARDVPTISGSLESVAGSRDNLGVYWIREGV